MAGGSSSGRSGRVLDCRSFWKAGAYEVPATPTGDFHDALETGDFDRARVHPKFLHTNATSHKWAFGAIAELLDNAVDEISNGATFIKVDKSINLKDNSPMLVFQDGNGFKTSTMRLGADAIVFTRAIRGSDVTLSIGLLSYTFLRRTMKDDIVVPMLDFKIQDGNNVPLVYGSQGDWESSLKIILDWSPFSSKEELLQQFQDIGSHGTKVAVYNLWMNDDGLLELDFEDDDEASIHAYTSILYLKKFDNFQIVLRGRPVEQIRIADELKFKKVVTYKPQVAHDSHVVSVTVDVGFAKEAPILGIFGMNVYHKNRLIMSSGQVQENNMESEGLDEDLVEIGSSGVLTLNFIEKLSEENIALFSRREELRQRDTQLKQTIGDLENELEETKRKCGQLAAELKARKNQQRRPYM
nr:unnamed protein product [Digitaria exilis]